MPGHPVAREKLDALGVDWLCDEIGDKKSLTEIAKDAGVSIGSLLTWVEADPDRSARVREARSVMARYWDEKAEFEITAAKNTFQLKRAKELAHHYRWRASKIRPDEYGVKVDHNHGGKLTLEQLVSGTAES